MLPDVLHTPASRLVRKSLFATYADRPILPSAQAEGYARLREFGGWAGGGRALLAEPGRLFAAMEAAAVADPFVFHTGQVHYGVCLAAALELADRPAQLRPLIDDLDTMRSIGTVLITELGSGSSHLAIRTRADFDPATGGFVLSTPERGAAKFMPNVALPGVAKTGLVYARVHVSGVDCGVFPFLVPIRSQHTIADGVVIEPIPGDNPADFALVRFDGARVGREQWLADGASVTDGVFGDPLGHPDQRLIRSLCVSANASASAAHAGVAAAQASVVVALRYAQGRTTMGRLGADLPVLAYRSQQQALLGALADAYAATVLLRRIAASPPPATQQTVTFAPWAAVHREMALTKATVTAMAEQIAATCRRRSGAQGVLPANRIVGYEALAAAYNSAAGDNHLTLLDTGRALIEGDSPALPGLAELRAAIGGNGFDDWNPHLPAVADLARAYASHLIAESLRSALDTAGSDRPLAQALTNIHLSPSTSDYDLVLDRLDYVLEAFDIPFTMAAT